MMERDPVKINVAAVLLFLLTQTISPISGKLTFNDYQVPSSLSAEKY